MAVFFPSLEQIKKIPDKATPGEMYLLNFLADNLDDRYEVYFQAHLCGSQPDVIIMLKGGGVLVIEVKDWNLDLYEYVNVNNWAVWDYTHERNYLVRSPLRQVLHYKNDLFEYHVPGLYERKLNNKRLYAVVSTMVFFHNSNSEDIASVVAGCLTKNESYIHLLGDDGLNRDNFNKILSSCYMRFGKSYFFTDEVYQSFRLILQPMEYYENVGKVIDMSPEQMAVIKSKRKEMKISGAAGSGKTQLMAKLAVLEAIKGKEVLILTFNITLRWYMWDMIRKVCMPDEWSKVKYRVTVSHYHVFVKNYLNENEQPIDDVKDENDSLSITDIPKDKRKRLYDAVFLDEVQDFMKEWVLDARAVLSANGKFYCFGDVGQNIYGRSTNSDKGPYTGIAGGWRILKNNYRLSSEISNLAAAFQRKYLMEKYSNDVFSPLQMELPLGEGTAEYVYRDIDGIKDVEKYIGQIIMKWEVHQNDICVLDDRFSELRMIDYLLRNNGINTSTVFETLELYNSILSQYKDFDERKKQLHNIRRSKKYNFYMNSGKLKLCSTHSFKGWEITNLILILHDNKHTPSEKEKVIPELIYTAITRCRKHLLILNLGCEKYHDFFNNEIGSGTIEKS